MLESSSTNYNDHNSEVESSAVFAAANLGSRPGLGPGPGASMYDPVRDADSGSSIYEPVRDTESGSSMYDPVRDPELGSSMYDPVRDAGRNLH